MLQVKINGMSCGHCVASVTRELEAAGASDVHVDLETGMVSWEGDVSIDKVAEIADDLGFNCKKSL